MRATRSGFALPLLILLLMAPTAAAQVVRTWVSAAGSDGNPCSRALPCRNFAPALLAVDPGGEIVVLDAGGFGAVLIDKSVSIISPAGIHAAIAPTTAYAIRIQGAPGDVVNVRGLYLNGRGGPQGIEVLTAQRVHIERTTIDGFQQGGIRVNPNVPNAVSIQDCTLRRNSSGLFITSLTNTARVTVDGTRFESNGVGLGVEDGANLVLRNSVVRDDTYGMFVQTEGAGDVDIVVEDSSISGSGSHGIAMFFSGGGVLSATLSRVHLGDNNVGVSVADSCVLRMSNSLVTGNTAGGVGVSGTGIFESRGNNTFRRNGTDVTGTITVIPGV